MNRPGKVLCVSAAVLLASCASTSSDLAGGPTADPHAAECAALRSQYVELNKTAVLPQYCKDLESLHWSTEAKDPMKLDLGKDKKGHE